MKTIIISFISSLVTLLALDVVWLKIMLSRFYSPRLLHLTAESPSYLPAVIFYVIYALGISIIIATPALTGSYSLTKVFLVGALFGLCAYGAYDFTNQATLKDWPTIVTIVDLIWGATLTGVASVSAVYFAKLFS